MVSWLAFLLVGLSACSPLASPAKGSAKESLAPLDGMDVDERIPNEYLVLFRKGYTLEQHFATIGKKIPDAVVLGNGTHTYGYGASLDEDTRDELVRRDPGVKMVETERPIYLVAPTEVSDDEEQESKHSRTVLRKREYKEINRPGAPYGLQMVTTAKNKLSTPVQDNGVYDYVVAAGLGVNVYVLDTGIRITHQAFDGRAYNFGGKSSSDPSPYVNGPMQDEHGHGTHVAGIVGAEQYGVAPHANLINVKVLGKDGRGRRLRDFAQAIIDINAEHWANRQKHGNGFWKFRGSVINMSLSWPGNGFAILDQLIDANDAGISVYAAAGNDNVDSSNTYPCANIQTKCIAAVDNSYKKAWFSNHGGSVDFIAPGQDILSLGISSDTALKRMSGTSQACPHAAGAAAIFTSWKGLVTKQDLSQSLVWWNSIDGVVSGFTGTTEHFITTGIHSPQKYPKEPFRWAGDYPQQNHIVLNVTIAGSSISPQSVTAPSVPASNLATSFSGYVTVMTTSSLPAITGFTTESGIASSFPMAFSSNASVSGNATTPPSVTPSSTVPSSTTASGVPTCSGNQIQGSCTQGTLPSATADSGPRGPVCNKADGGTYLMFNATQASDGVSEYCSNLISKGVVLSDSTASPAAGFVSDAAENGGYVAITVLYDVRSCDPGTSTEDQKLDFSTWDEDTCYQYLYTTLASECAKDSSWPDYDPDYSIEGGIFGASCALWSLDGLPGSPP